MTTPRTAAAPPSWLLVLAGFLSLAAAMGIGRFAFTPLLPLMVREGQLDVAAGGWIAAGNYAGYFVGAITAARVPLGARALAVLGLALTAASTAAMLWPNTPGWIALRFLAGVASAWVFVATSVWCLGALSQRGVNAGGWVYAGVGAGIALAGGWCVANAGATAASLWVQLGVLALALAAPVLAVLAKMTPAAAPIAAAPSGTATPAGVRGLIVCYGLMGFGYILPATFLPVLARTVVDDPRLFGLAWPVFGATAAISTALAGWAFRHATRLQVWAVCQAAMGVGVLLPSLWLDGFTVGLSALLVGGTFMVITLAGVQEMRARAVGHPAALVGRLTAAFAFGQIAGPAASAALLHWPALRDHGLQIALQIAAACLLASAFWLWRRWVVAPSTPETVHA